VTGGVRTFPGRIDEEAEEARRRPFRRWLAVIKRPIIILREHERPRTWVGSLVNNTAVVAEPFVEDLRWP
jgi:hypothetical protein